MPRARCKGDCELSRTVPRVQPASVVAVCICCLSRQFELLRRGHTSKLRSDLCILPDILNWRGERAANTRTRDLELSLRADSLLLFSVLAAGCRGGGTNSPAPFSCHDECECFSNGTGNPSHDLRNVDPFRKRGQNPKVACKHVPRRCGTGFQRRR